MDSAITPASAGIDARLQLLEQSERSSLTLALELTASFLGIELPQVLGAFHAAAPVAGSSEGAPRPVSTKKAAKMRARLVKELYSDDLRSDLVDRAIFAIEKGLASPQEINRGVVTAVRSARQNAEKKQEPTRAWLLFYPFLRSIYERAGVEFPTLKPGFEPEPPELEAARLERARLQSAVNGSVKRDENGFNFV